MARLNVLRFNNRSEWTPRWVTSVCLKAELPLLKKKNKKTYFLETT